MTDFCLKKCVEPLERISILFDKKKYISSPVSTGTFYIIQRKYMKAIVYIVVNTSGQYAFVNEIHIVLSSLSLLKYVQSKYCFPTPAKQYNERARFRYSLRILIQVPPSVYNSQRRVFCVPVFAFFTHGYKFGAFARIILSFPQWEIRS